MRNLTCVLAEAENLSFAEGSFDLIICAQIIGHIQDLDAFLERVSFFLSREGKLIISTGNSLSLCEFMDRFSWKVEKGINISLPEVSLNQRGFWRISYWELKHLLVKNNFRIATIYGADLLSSWKRIPLFISKGVEKLSEIAPFCFFSHYIILSVSKTDKKGVLK